MPKLWPTHGELHRLFKLSRTGLIWRVPGGIANHTHAVGDAVGCISPAGYVNVGFTISGCMYRLAVHRIVWFLRTKELPPFSRHVHHIDGNKANNAFSNLAVVDPGAHTKLHANIKSPCQLKKIAARSDSACCLLGVHRTRARRWSMQFKVRGEQIQATFCDVVTAVDTYWCLKIIACPQHKSAFRTAHREQRERAIKLKEIYSV